MVQHGPTWSNMVQYGPTWSNMVQSHPKKSSKWVRHNQVPWSRLSSVLDIWMVCA